MEKNVSEKCIERFLKKTANGQTDRQTDEGETIVLPKVLIIQNLNLWIINHVWLELFLLI